MYARYHDRGFEVVAFPANDFRQQEPGTNQGHGRTRQTYGPERLQAELRADGFPAGIGRIKRLRCTQVRRFTTTTASNHALPVAENILAQTVVATGPNETWGTDITYVLTAKGWSGIKESVYLRGCRSCDEGPDDDGLGDPGVGDRSFGKTSTPRPIKISCCSSA